MISMYILNGYTFYNDMYPYSYVRCARPGFSIIIYYMHFLFTCVLYQIWQGLQMIQDELQY